MSENIILVLVYHRHKLSDVIKSIKNTFMRRMESRLNSRTG
jgi:hypothetical protein